MINRMINNINEILGDNNIYYKKNNLAKPVKSFSIYMFKNMEMILNWS
jgi:hypothetical protein